MQDKKKYALWIKTEAKRLGFHSCGISKADFLSDEAPRLEAYLKNDYHGKMKYMENHFDKRLDPRLLVEGAKSVISLSYNYFADTVQPPNAPILSRYAYGKDYHLVIKEKLFNLLSFINQRIGEVRGRVFTDSAPVLERAWAVKSGLGWIGKNGLMISHKHGSYFFLAEIILDLDLEDDQPVGAYCGTCTRCIDACPTGALIAPMQLDARKCISYLTIELKEDIPENFRSQLSNRFFGCDICQEVCPWNRFSLANKTPAFIPKPELSEMNAGDWLDLSEELFQRLFKESPLQRAGYQKIKSNLLALYPSKSENN